MKNSMLRIGTGPRDYIAFRAFEQVPVPGAQFIRVPYVPVRRIGGIFTRLSSISQGVGLYFPVQRVDLLHSCNAVLLNHSPWVISFESTLPRIWNAPRLETRLLRSLAHPSCRRVIAMSQNAKTHLVLRNRSRSELAAILAKTTVIYPSVEDDAKALESRISRNSDGVLRLIFVGNEFFRKGGPYVVEAYERLRKKHQLHLMIVSTISENNDIYAVEPGSKETWRKRMEANGVRWVHHVAPQEVRGFLAESDILVLPTLEDSFGFSAVEAMATGLAVIATRVEALPEIVDHEKTGRLIDVPVNEEGRLIWNESVGRGIVDELTKMLESLVGQPNRLREMGMRGRLKYEKEFKPEVIGKELAEVYRSAVGDV